MTIDQHCKSQQITADRIFMDFKYTKPGSTEQLRALESLHSLVCQWAIFFDFNERYGRESVSLKEAVVFSNTY